jgi:hypothetical protein
VNGRSPADTAAAEVLAEVFHELRCVPVVGAAQYSDQHLELDIAKGWFLLDGLTERGWQLCRVEES